MSGIVYVLTNDWMPGLVKIGMTTRTDINTRLNELHTTGVPVAFNCEFACEVAEQNCAKIESALHKAFKPYRINPKREFFEIKPYQAIAILELFQSEEITQEISEKIDSSLTTEEKFARIRRRPKLNFYDMGLSNGTVLTFVKDVQKTCQVCDKNHVFFDNEEYTLTALTRNLLEAPRNVAPTQYWIVNEKNLQDLYNETYPFEEEM